MSPVFKNISPETLELIQEGADHLGISPDEYLRRLLPSEQELALKADASDDEFEADMKTFGQPTETSINYTGSYSRADIYEDRD